MGWQDDEIVGGHPVKKTGQMTAGNMFSGAMQNLPSSAMQFGKDVVEPFLSPIETAKSVANLGQSVLGKVGLTDADPELANQVGQHFVNRYGSIDNAMRTFSTDPVGMASDAAGLLTGGGALAAKVASKAPRIARVAQAVESTGRFVDPLNLAAKTVTGTAKGTAGVLGLTTGTGYEAVKEAAKAGFRGGEQGQAFISEMRGKAPQDAVVNEAQKAVDSLREKRSRDYKTTMAGVTQDKTVLDFQPIRDEFQKLKEMGQFKGKTINEPAVAAVEKLEDIIGDWEFSNPNEFHTPEGLDKLKQKIWNQSKGYPENSPERLVADRMYKAVRQVVANQAPDYMKVMGDYEQASDLLKELERGLSLSDRATVDTTTRKLQSILRNNANTNYGQRVALGRQLEQAGAETLFPRLAGQAMSAQLPRGLSGALSGTGAVVNTMQNLPGALLEPSTLLAAGMVIPRVTGEAAYKVGQIASGPRRLAEMLSKYGDQLSARNPSMAMAVDMAKRTIAAGKKLDPVYTQQLALQLSRLQQADEERNARAAQ